MSELKNNHMSTELEAMKGQLPSGYEIPTELLPDTISKERVAKNFFDIRKHFLSLNRSQFDNKLFDKGRCSNVENGSVLPSLQVLLNITTVLPWFTFKALMLSDDILNDYEIYLHEHGPMLPFDKTESKGMAAQMGKLSDKLKSAIAEKRDMETKLKNATDEAAILSAEVAKLSASTADLKTLCAKIEVENNMLQTQIDTQKELVESLRELNAMLKEKNNSPG